MCSSAWRNEWLQGHLWNLRDWTWTTLQLSSTLMDRADFCKTCACILHCQWLRMQILVGNYQICGACSLINVPLASSVPTWNALRLNYDCTASVSVGARGPALVQCQDSRRKWSDCLGWRRRKAKQQKKLKKKGKRQRTERGRDESGPVRSVRPPYPFPDRCLVRVCCFWDHIRSFRKIQNIQFATNCLCHDLGLSIVFNMPARGINWNTDRLPCDSQTRAFPRLPPSQPICTSARGWCLHGGEVHHGTVPPGCCFGCFLLVIYEREMFGERGKGAACPGTTGAGGAAEWQPAGSAEPKALAAAERRVINNAEWILASLRAEKIIPRLELSER